jgi:hypothetical protein
MTNKPIHDLEDDAPRFVIEALKAVAPEKVDVDALADSYDPPRPNNMTEIRSMYNEGRDRDDRLDTDQTKSELIQDSVRLINALNREIADPVIELIGYSYRLADGVDTAALVDREGQPLIPQPVLAGLFDPETGAFAENIRTPNPEGYTELRESMKAFGWDPRRPAIQDENGVVIEGHRRLHVAAELGIEPKIITLTFGTGEAGDGARLKSALISNIGFERMTPSDRKAIAARLYQDGRGWRLDRIAETLNVSIMTISRDLRNLTSGKSTPDQPKRGRPRKQQEPDPKPWQPPAADRGPLEFTPDQIAERPWLAPKSEWQPRGPELESSVDGLPLSVDEQRRNAIRRLYQWAVEVFKLAEEIVAYGPTGVPDEVEWIREANLHLEAVGVLMADFITASEARITSEAQS